MSTARIRRFGEPGRISMPIAFGGRDADSAVRAARGAGAAEVLRATGISRRGWGAGRGGVDLPALRAFGGEPC